MKNDAISCQEALQLMLNQVDYTSHSCSSGSRVYEVLPREVIILAKAALEAERKREAKRYKDFKTLENIRKSIKEG